MTYEDGRMTEEGWEEVDEGVDELRGRIEEVAKVDWGGSEEEGEEERGREREVVGKEGRREDKLEAKVTVDIAVMESSARMDARRIRL